MSDAFKPLSQEETTDLIIAEIRRACTAAGQWGNDDLLRAVLFDLADSKGIISYNALTFPQELEEAMGRQMTRLGLRTTSSRLM